MEQGEGETRRVHSKIVLAAPLHYWNRVRDICRTPQSDKARSLQWARCHGRKFLQNRFCLALSCCAQSAGAVRGRHCMHFYGNARQKHTKFNELQKAAKVLAARFTPGEKKTGRQAAAGNLQPAQFGATKRRMYTLYIYICKIYVYVCERTQLECKLSCLRLRCATSARSRQIVLVNALNCALCGPN